MNKNLEFDMIKKELELKKIKTKIVINFDLNFEEFGRFFLIYNKEKISIRELKKRLNLGTTKILKMIKLYKNLDEKSKVILTDFQMKNSM